MSKGGIAKTFSFEALEDSDNKAPGASTTQSPPANPADRPGFGQKVMCGTNGGTCAGREEAKTGPNPFLKTEEQQTAPPVPPPEPIKIIDRPPDYSPNRKAYTGSPDFVLSKRPNKLGKHLPKAFTMQPDEESSPLSKFRSLDNQVYVSPPLDLKEKNLLHPNTVPSKQNTASSQGKLDVIPPPYVQERTEKGAFCCRLDSQSQAQSCGCLII